MDAGIDESGIEKLVPICCYPCSAININLAKNNWSLVSLRVTYHFVNLIHVPVSLLLTHMFLRLSLYPICIMSSFADSPLSSSTTPSMFQSRLNCTCVTNPSPYIYFFPLDCLHGLLPGPFLLRNLVFGLVFPYFSFLVHCVTLICSALCVISSRIVSRIVATWILYLPHPQQRFLETESATFQQSYTCTCFIVAVCVGHLVEIMLRRLWKSQCNSLVLMWFSG